MCSQIYTHPVEGYRCFANANKSQGTYYTCCDIDTREIRYATYIYDGYFMGHYLIQSSSKAANNPFNEQHKLFFSSMDKYPYTKSSDDEYTIDRQYPMQSDIPSQDEIEYSYLDSLLTAGTSK